MALAKREQRSNDKVLPLSDMDPQASLLKDVVVVLVAFLIIAVRIRHQLMQHSRQGQIHLPPALARLYFGRYRDQMT